NTAPMDGIQPDENSQGTAETTSGSEVETISSADTAESDTYSEKPLTGVEQYIRSQEQSTAASTETRVEAYIQRKQEDASTPSFKPLSSVDRYLIKQARQQHALTSVDRYLDRINLPLETESAQEAE